MRQEQEHQGIYTNSFSGLDLSLSSGAIEPSGSTVFQNCDVSADGAIVRRAGTRVLYSLDFGLGNSAKTWQATVKTRNGTEYLAVVQDGGIVVTRITPDGSDSLSFGKSVLKTGVFKQPLVNVNFVLLAAPYDRLLILTGNHPPIELSFLERTIEFVVTTPTVTDRQIVAPFSSNDYFGWQDRNPQATLVWDPTTLQEYDVLSKQTGFNVTLTNNPGIPNGVKVLSIASITWQWWAEAAFYIGGEFNQSVTRTNVTAADQNVSVPVELITDYPPVLADDIYSGLFVSSNSAVCTDNAFALARSPQTAVQYNFTAGGNYVYNANYVPAIAPYFVTFGGIQTVGTISPCHIHRRRLLPFRSYSNVDINSLRVLVNKASVPLLSGTCLLAGVAASLYNYSQTPTANLYNTVAVGTNPQVRAIDFMAGNTRVPFDAYVRVFDVYGRTFLGANAQTVWALDEQQSSVAMDGRFTPAYGIGDYCNYLAGVFPLLGTVYRNRLILRGEGTSDQLVASCNGDAIVANEFYNFFQITQSLKGDPTDPFTLNITSDAKSTITAIAAWQDTLLAFTTENVFAVRGEPFAEGTVRSTLVAAQGAFNNNCVVVSELSLVFMNRYGLFDLVNKQNTSELGVLERSTKVRALFNNDLAPSQSDSLHWLHFDDSSTTIWVGLATTDSLFTTRHLTLNTTWDSWATFVGAVPYLMRKPVKLYNRTLLFCVGSSRRWLVTAITNQPFYIDFAQYVTNRAWTDDSVISNSMSVPFTPTPQKIYKTEQAFMPGLRDAEGTDIVKVLTSWVSQTLTQSALRARSFIADLPSTKWLVGNPALTPTRYAPLVAVSSQHEFHLYPQSVEIAAPTTPTSHTLLQPVTYEGVTLPNVVHSKLRGMFYQSIVASPTFDFASMGRLKRLKKLHLQFDPSIALGSKYNFVGLTNVRQRNMALVAIATDIRPVSYAVATQPLATQPLSVQPSVDLTLYSAPVEAGGNAQHTVSLQGMSVNYRWFLSSVGAEAFKLNGYEFEVQPQRSKNYQRG